VTGRAVHVVDAMARIRGQERADALLRQLQNERATARGDELFLAMERLEANEIKSFAGRLQKRIAQLLGPQ